MGAKRFQSDIVVRKLVLQRHRQNGTFSTGDIDDSAEIYHHESPAGLAGVQPGSMVIGDNGVWYRANSSGAMEAMGGSLATANTWEAEQTFAAGASFLDDDAITLGTGDDDTLKHDGTNSYWNHATGNLIVDNQAATGATYVDLGTDTSATEFGVRNNSLSRLFIITGAGLITLADGTTLQRPGAGTGTGDVIERVGATTTEGMEVRVYEATVVPAAVETALFTVPANSVIDSVQANCQAVLTGGGTTVTWGIGITGDVDKFGTVFAAGAQSNSLAKNSKVNAIGSTANAGAGVGVFNPAAVDLKLIGAAAGGAAAGDTALTVGSVRVVVRYRVLINLTDAP